MPAYVFSEVAPRQGPAFQRYRELASASIASHGGRYLVRGVLPEAAEGEWRSDARAVLVEFPDEQSLLAWYRSPEYRPALAIRDEALERRLLFLS